MPTSTNIKVSVQGKDETEHAVTYRGRQKRMEKAVKYLQHYMATYSNQECYRDYSEETLIDDVLYGLGVALGRKRYSFAPGFEKFKARLIKHLSK